MGERVVPEWEERFLAALAATGTVRVAAEMAGVDYSTAYARRARSGAFRDRWAEALAAHGRGERPDAGMAEATRELVPQGGKLVRAGEGRWSRQKERHFLAELAASTNVRRAASAAGVSTAAVYKQRQNDRGFVARWDEALAMGRARVEALLVEAAEHSLDPGIADGSGRVLPEVSAGEAIAVLRLKGGGEAKAGSATDNSRSSLEEATKRLRKLLGRMRREQFAKLSDAGFTRRGGFWIPPGWTWTGEGPAPFYGPEGERLDGEPPPDPEWDLDYAGPSAP